MMMETNKTLLWHDLFWVRFKRPGDKREEEREKMYSDQLYAWRERHQLDVKWVKDNGSRSTEEVTKVLCADNV